METTTIDHMLGQTFSSVRREDDSIVFENAPVQTRFEHYQDCCERVWIEDLCGDLSDLAGAPILVAEQCEKSSESDNGDLSGWAFYRFATVKGAVTVRWQGESNGYYGVGVGCCVFNKEENKKEWIYP